MKKKTWLTLDLGKTQTGYAIMHGIDVITSGSWRFGDVQHDAELFDELYDKIDSLRKGSESEIEMIVFEHAFRQPGRAGEVFQVLATAVKVYAHHHAIPLARVTPSQVKWSSAHSGNANKLAIRKGVEVRTGHKPKSSDEADAIGVGLAAFDNLNQDRLTILQEAT